MLTNKCLVEGKGLGSVMCLGWYLSNGSAHLAVGRHDGSVQLYFVDMENIAEKPRLKYTYVRFFQIVRNQFINYLVEDKYVIA